MMQFICIVLPAIILSHLAVVLLAIRPQESSQEEPTELACAVQPAGEQQPAASQSEPGAITGNVAVYSQDRHIDISPLAIEHQPGPDASI